MLSKQTTRRILKMMRILCFTIFLSITYGNPTTTDQPTQQDLVRQWRMRHPTLRQAWSEFHTTCYGGCFNTQEFIDVYWKGTQFLNTMMANFVTQQRWEAITPKVSQDELNRQCGVLNNTRACVANCSSDGGETREGDRLHKAQSESILDLISRFCDDNLKSDYQCVLGVWSTVSPQCQTKCDHYKSAAMREISKYRHAMERLYNLQQNYDGLLRDTLSIVGNYTCRFLNCRQNCRRNDLVTKCGDRGYTTTKQLMQLIGDILQKLRDEIPSVTPRGRDAVPELPEECTGERLAAEEDPE